MKCSPPTKRTAWLSRDKRVNPRRATARRSDRVRDIEFLSWVHTRPCCAIGLNGHVCDGPIEADHVGPRPMGRKADDRTCIALCRLAHRQRTDFSGVFRDFDQARMRRWIAEQLITTAAAWAARDTDSPEAM